MEHMEQSIKTVELSRKITFHFSGNPMKSRNTKWNIRNESKGRRKRLRKPQVLFLLTCFHLVYPPLIRPILPVL